MKTKKTRYALTLIAVLVGALALAGCTQTDARNTTPNGAPRGFGNGTFNGIRGGMDGFGNVTEAQRQERAQQRMLALTKACEGKAENDACTLAGRDNRNGTAANLTLQGTCHALNGTMQCWPAFQERQGQPRPAEVSPSATPDGYGQLPQ